MAGCSSGRARRASVFGRGEGVLLIRHDVSSGHARAHIFLRGKRYLYGREPPSAGPVPALHRNGDRRHLCDHGYLVGVFRLSLSVLISCRGWRLRNIATLFILILASFTLPSSFLPYLLSYFFFHPSNFTLRPSPLNASSGNFTLPTPRTSRMGKHVSAKLIL
jgi:hypothetical protein